MMSIISSTDYCSDRTRMQKHCLNWCKTVCVCQIDNSCLNHSRCRYHLGSTKFSITPGSTHLKAKSLEPNSHHTPVSECAIELHVIMYARTFLCSRPGHHPVFLQLQGKERNSPLDLEVLVSNSNNNRSRDSIVYIAYHTRKSFTICFEHIGLYVNSFFCQSRFQQN